MNDVVILCELCRSDIGTVLLDKIKTPVMGDMFGSIDPVHEVPPPFDGENEWRYMMCPFGKRHRPFIEPDLIATSRGWLIADEKGYSFTGTLPAERAALHDATIVELMAINYGNNMSDLNALRENYPVLVDAESFVQPQKKRGRPAKLNVSCETSPITKEKRKEIAADVAKYRSQNKKRQHADRLPADKE